VFKRRDDTGKKDSPKPKATGAADASTTFLRPSLGADTSVTGRLSFEAPTRIDGKLRGEVRAGDLLVIGETGLVEGVVRAVKLIVRGQVHGEIRGAHHVEIVAGAMVTGIIEAHTLTVHPGATLDGDVKIAPPRSATVHVLHPSNVQ
jgi:cytoskeletal protein CcmA (bactofilin family)